MVAVARCCQRFRKPQSGVRGLREMSVTSAEADGYTLVYDFGFVSAAALLSSLQISSFDVGGFCVTGLLLIACVFDLHDCFATQLDVLTDQIHQHMYGK